MIGLINLSVQAFITETFGADKWQAVVQAAHTDTNWVSSCPYSDKVTYDIVIAAAGLLGVTIEQALEAYGVYFVQYAAQQGYAKLLGCLGANLGQLLQNLNDLHLHLSMAFPAMAAPAFRCENVGPESLELHYISSRPGLWPIVVGVLKALSKELYGGIELDISLIKSRDKGDNHEVFLVRYPYQASMDYSQLQEAAAASSFSLTTSEFYILFPYHLILDTECRLVQCGSGLTRLFSETLQPGRHIEDTFKLKHPYMPFDFERMKTECGTSFLLRANRTGLELKGQMLATTMPRNAQSSSHAGQPVLVFLCSPRVGNLDDMQTHKIFLSDIPLHDMSRDFVLLAEQRQAEADLKERFEQLALDLRAANDRLQQTTRWLAEEKARSDHLLYQMLPPGIADELRAGGTVEAIQYPEVTVLFSDIVGFTVTSSKCTASEVYHMLNQLYNRFDALVDEFPDIYKLETIGDAYMLVCNLTTDCPSHVDTVVDFAIRMQEEARQVWSSLGEPIQLRIGIHTGPVAGGVMGSKMPRFCIIGDTVNTASRMESHGVPGKIHLSAASYAAIVEKDKFMIKERGVIAVKGKGKMKTYLIAGINDHWLLRNNSSSNLSFTDPRLQALLGRENSFHLLSHRQSANGFAADMFVGPMSQEGREMQIPKSIHSHQPYGVPAGAPIMLLSRTSRELSIGPSPPSGMDAIAEEICSPGRSSQTPCSSSAVNAMHPASRKSLLEGGMLRVVPEAGYDMTAKGGRAQAGSSNDKRQGAASGSDGKKKGFKGMVHKLKKLMLVTGSASSAKHA